MVEQFCPRLHPQDGKARAISVTCADVPDLYYTVKQEPSLIVLGMLNTQKDMKE